MNRLLLACSCLLLGGAAGIYVAVPVIEGRAAPKTEVKIEAPRELTSFRDVVKKVLPAVVSIEVKAKPRKQPTLENEDDEPQHGFGSGFLVDPKGVILTNFHVVQGADQVEVRLTNGDKFVSKEIKTDPKSDLAIVRIAAKEDLPYLELGDSSAMEQGDRVLAFGAPFGLTGSVTAGIISAKGRSLNARGLHYEDFLQTDAAINPGNSGGPLVSLEGKVIGINSAIKTRTGGFQGVGLAIASNLAKDVMDKLLKDGVVHRGYLGIQMKELANRELAKRLGVEAEGGILVSQAFQKAPAAKGGLKDGDILMSLDGKTIRNGRQLQNTVASLPLGKPIEVKVIRDGKPKMLKVTIEEQPADYGNERVQLPKVPKPDKSAIALDNIGAMVMDVTSDLAEQIGLKNVKAGAIVVRVKRDSPAYDAGIFPGMVITRTDKQAVKSAADVRDALSKKALENGVVIRGISTATGTTFALVKATPDADK
jgi:serine protease Do